MPDRVRLRTAIDRDAAELHAFAGRLYGERLSTIFLHDQVPSVEEEQRFIASFASDRDRLVLAFVGDRVIGMLGFRGHTRPQLRHAGVLALSVDRDHRRRGIGSLLLADLCAWIDEHPVLRRTELDVFATNTPAIRLFEQHGFVREGVMHEAVEVEGALIDNLLMARRRPAPPKG